MKNAIIYVFSGTGNTKKACDIYKNEFEKNGVETTLYTVKKGFENLPDPNNFDYVGFAYPIHGFNAPYIMLDLAKHFRGRLKKSKTYAKKRRKISKKAVIFTQKTAKKRAKTNNISSSKRRVNR